MRTWILLASVVLLTVSWKANAAPPDLTGKELSVDYEDPTGATSTHVKPGVYRIVNIVIVSGGEPGSNSVVARILNPSSWEIGSCKDGNFTMIGSYSKSGHLKLKLSRASCSLIHELELDVSRRGTLSGKWGMSAAWGIGFLPASGRCINCAPGDMDWTIPMIAAAVLALLGWIFYRRKQIAAAKRAAPATAVRKVQVPPTQARDEGPSFEGLELTGAAARPRREEEPRRRQAEEAAQRKAEEKAAARRAAEEAKKEAALEATRKKDAADALKRKAADELERRKVAQEVEKRAEARRALEAEHERLKEQVVKSGHDLISRVQDPKRRAFYEAFLKRHEDDPAKLRLAIEAVAMQMAGEGDPAAREAEVWRTLEKQAESIRDWSMRVNRLLSWVIPGSSAILGMQAAAYGAVAGTEEGGAKGAGKSGLRTGVDMLTGGMATRLYDSKGNVIQAIDDKLKEYDYREYEKRLRNAKKKFDKGEWADAAGEALDTVLDAADTSADAASAIKSRAHAKSGLSPSTAGGVEAVVGATDRAKPKKRRKKQESEGPDRTIPLKFETVPEKRAAWEVEAEKRKQADRTRQRKAREEAPPRRAADEAKWREKSKDLVGVAVGNEFEKGFHGWDRDNPHIWVEDLDKSIKEAFNPLGETDMQGARSPLIDKRLYHGENAANPNDTNRNQAGFASVAASNASSSANYYKEKFTRLLTQPFDANHVATKKLLQFLNYEKDPGKFIDRTSLWLPAADQAKARQAVGRHLFKNGAYDFSPIQDYVDHLRRTRPDLKTNTDIARELLKKIQGRTPWDL